MGWKTGAIAGATLGSSFGPIGTLVGGLAGGVLFKEGKSVTLKKEGVYFKNGLVVPWNNVCECSYDSAEEAEKDCEEWILLKNGLELRWKESVREFVDKQSVLAAARERNKMSFADCCEEVKRIDTASRADECLSVADRCLSLFSLGVKIAKIDDETVTICSPKVPQFLFDFTLGIRMLDDAVPESSDESVSRRFSDWACQNLDAFQNVVHYWADKFERWKQYLLPEEREKIAVNLSASMLNVRMLTDDQGIDAWGSRLAQVTATSKNEGIRKCGMYKCIRLLWIKNISDRDKANLRKVIICSDPAWEIGSLFSSFPEEVQVLSADELEETNSNTLAVHEEDKVEFWIGKSDVLTEPDAKAAAARKAKVAREQRIKDHLYRFDEGHPRSGCVYLQSPVDCNRYYEVNEYHSSLLKDKHEELQKLFCSLGAFNYSCESRWEGLVSVSRESTSRVDGASGCNVGGFSGMLSGSYAVETSEQSKGSLFARYMSAGTLCPVECPKIPDGMYFYWHNKQWQELAQRVLARSQSSIDVELDCKEANSVKSTELEELSSSLKLSLVTFDIGIKDQFKREEEEMRTCSIKYKVDFVDSLGRWADEYLADHTAVSKFKESMNEDELGLFRMLRKFVAEKRPIDQQSVVEWAQQRGINAERAHRILDAVVC